MITSHWGCWVSWLVPEKKEKKRKFIKKKKKKSKGKARLKFIQFCFVYTFQG